MGHIRTLRVMLALGALGGLVACSGPEVRYDYDVKANYSAYQSYDWQAAPAATRGKDGGFDNTIVNARVRRAVEEALAAKGMRKETSADPDFLVTYYPLRDPVAKHHARLGLGLGIGPIGVGVSAPVGDRQAPAEGSIVLEIKDFRSGILVWKATAPGALQGSDSPEEADKDVADAVQAMLKRFPPK